MSLGEALERAKAELLRLREEQARWLQSSGLSAEVERLTAENKALTERRAEAKERIAELEQALGAARLHGTELEQQLRDARARVKKLGAAVGSRR